MPNTENEAINKEWQASLQRQGIIGRYMKGTLTAENNAMLAQANKQAALTGSLKLGKGHARVQNIAPSLRAAASVAAAAPVVTPSVAAAAPVGTATESAAAHANINVSNIPNYYPSGNNGGYNNESPENALARLTAEVEAENAGNVSRSVFNNIRAQQAAARDLSSAYAGTSSAVASAPMGAGRPSPFMTMLFGSKATPGVSASRPVGGGVSASRPVGGGLSAAPLNKAGAVFRLKRAKIQEDSIAHYEGMVTRLTTQLRQLEQAGATPEKTTPVRQLIQKLLVQVAEKEAQVQNLQEEVRTRYRPSRHRRSKKRATRRKHRN
jgi:hypothetical protein